MAGVNALNVGYSYYATYILSGKVFNDTATYQNVGLDISNVTFMSFVVNGCTSVNVILGTNSSHMFNDYYLFYVLPTAVLI